MCWRKLYGKGKGVSYHKMPDWFGGIIMATIFTGVGFGLIYYVMYFLGINYILTANMEKSFRA